jgi:hypothetical protein
LKRKIQGQKEKKNQKQSISRDEEYHSIWRKYSRGQTDTWMWNPVEGYEKVDGKMNRKPKSPEIQKIKSRKISRILE